MLGVSINWLQEYINQIWDRIIFKYSSNLAMFPDFDLLPPSCLRTSNVTSAKKFRLLSIVRFNEHHIHNRGVPIKWKRNRNETKRTKRDKTKPTKTKRNRLIWRKWKKKNNKKNKKVIQPIFTITMLDYFPHISMIAVFHQERKGFDHHWTRIICIYSAGACPFDFVASFKFGNVKSVNTCTYHLLWQL